MTRDETIAHWRNGANDSLEVARLAHAARKYALTLFHCHLAVEKALKAAYVEERDEAPPPTHHLLRLASQLQQPWTEEYEWALNDLTRFAVAARYDDPGWAEREATEQSAAAWIARTEQLLPLISHGHT